MKGLTDKQREIATFYGQFQFENNYPPTVRDVANHFKMSTKGAYDHIKALEKKGILSGGENTSRSRTLLDKNFIISDDTFTIPILGRVAAGTPLICEENKDYEISVSSSLIPSKTKVYFGMEVRGESMIEKGIFSGDIAILEKTETAENGEIVMASIDENYGNTLKQFYKHSSNIELRPANSSMNPIIVRNCRILGKLVMTIRRY